MASKLGLPVPGSPQSSQDSVKSSSRVELMASQPQNVKGQPAKKQQSFPQVSLNSIDTFSEFSAKFGGMGTASATSVPNVMSAAPVGPVRLQRDRWYSKRVRRRLVYKNGECNITQSNIKKRKQRYLADIFTTLVDLKWRYNLLVFVLAFTLSWLVFALLWWLICFAHGDFEQHDKGNHMPCVEDVTDFTTALLFSIETQHTIGYGTRHTTQNCPEAILMMMFQSCFGVIIQALMTGLVFAKISRPKKRAETLMFSKNAVICKRDGELCLLFRVGDMRKSNLVEAHVRAILIKKRVTQEGEVMPLYQYEMSVADEENSEQKLFLVWPVILEHRITESSPLYELCAEDLHKEQFELIIILEGIVESTGMTTQARTSYLPGEILWGHRFERLVTFQKENGQYLIDYARFHSTVPVDIPQCSAKDLGEMGSISDEVEHDVDEDENSSMTSETKEATATPLNLKRNHFTQVGSTASLGTVSDSEEVDIDLLSEKISHIDPYQYLNANRITS